MSVLCDDLGGGMEGAEYMYPPKNGGEHMYTYS